MLKFLWSLAKRAASAIALVAQEAFYRLVGKVADIYYNVTSITPDKVGREMKRSIKRAVVGVTVGAVAKILPSKAVDFVNRRVSYPCAGVLSGGIEGVKAFARDLITTQVANAMGTRPATAGLYLNM